METLIAGHPIISTMIVIISTIIILYLLNQWSFARKKSGVFSIGLIFLALGSISQFAIFTHDEINKMNSETTREIKQSKSCKLIKYPNDPPNVIGEFYCLSTIQGTNEKTLKENIALKFMGIIITTFFVSIGGSLIAAAFIKKEDPKVTKEIYNKATKASSEEKLIFSKSPGTDSNETGPQKNQFEENGQERFPIHTKTAVNETDPYPDDEHQEPGK